MVCLLFISYYSLPPWYILRCGKDSLSRILIFLRALLHLLASTKTSWNSTNLFFLVYLLSILNSFFFSFLFSFSKFSPSISGLWINQNKSVHFFSNYQIWLSDCECGCARNFIQIGTRIKLEDRFSSAIFLIIEMAKKIS